MRTGLIYLHTNIVNRKVYVGQTIQKLNRRARPGHMKECYINCLLMARALEKYGEESFTTTILEENILEIDLTSKEEYYIKLYDSTNPEKGYNIKNIVDNKIIFTDEIKKKISNSQKEYAKNNPVEKAVNRKEHKIINNVINKHCSDCDTWKDLNSYHKNKTGWDGLKTICKECSIDRRSKQVKSTPNLNSEEYALAIKTRQQGVKIKAENPVTGDIKIYNTVRESMKDGFSNGSVSECLRSGKLHKGYKFTRL